jgi:hypothetical protein
LANGASVKVNGKVGEYRGKVQVRVENASGLQISGGGAAAGASSAVSGATTATALSGSSASGSSPPSGGGMWGASGSSSAGAAAAPAAAGGITKIGSLSAANKDQVVTISGKVTAAKKPANDRAPYQLTVNDGTGSIMVVFWSTLATTLPANKQMETDDQIQVTGKLGDYRGTLQVRLEDANSLKTSKSDPSLFTGAGAATSGAGASSGGSSTSGKAPLDVSSAANGTAPSGGAASAASLSSLLSSAPVGQHVAIKGEVSSIEPLRLGRKLQLVDAATNSGAIVLLWDTADDGVPPDTRFLKLHNKLSVNGTVADAQGQKVLVVSKPEEVVSVTP